VGVEAVLVMVVAVRVGGGDISKKKYTAKK
jgi:hypothetical protein